MSWRRALPWLLLFAAIAAGGGGLALPGIGGDDGDDSRSRSSATARVTRVVDGDTIKVELAGRRETVRYIGVDTPESVKPNTPVQCFAKAASHFNERVVGGERVRLHHDAEERDRYGRLLAYVYRARDGLFVNAELVRRGYAVPLTIAPNVAHVDEFVELARRARELGRGLWRACR